MGRQRTREFLHPLPELLQVFFLGRYEAGGVLGGREACSLRGEDEARRYPRAGDAAGALGEEGAGLEE